MKWSLLNQPIGLSCPAGCPTRKEVFWLIPMAAAAAISGISQGIGAAASKRANDRARQQTQDEKNLTEAERRKNKYQTWTDTLNGRNTIRHLQDSADREIARITGAAKVGGATEAQVAAEKDALRNQQAEVIADAAARHEDNVDVKDASYRQQISGLNQQLINQDLQQGLNTAQVASSVGNTLANAAAMAAMNMGAGSPGGGGTNGTGETTQFQQMNTPVKTTTPLTPEMQMAEATKYFTGGYGKNYGLLKNNPDFQRVMYELGR